MINIRELRIGDIITKENKYEGYKYSIVERETDKTRVKPSVK